jgi:GNAT superfamily N-acetyltransferase
MDIDVRRVDPDDDDALAARQAVAAATRTHDVPDLPAPCPVRYAGLLRHPPRTREALSWLAYLDGVPAGLLDMDLPTQENTGDADVSLMVAPAYRRRGVGRVLHVHAVMAAQRYGRVRLLTNVAGTLPGGPPRDGAGAAFAAVRGAKLALSEVRRRLDLSTVDLSAVAVPEPPGYTLVHWRDRAPERYLRDIGRLDGRMATDAPQGDLTFDVPVIDADRVREDEEVRLRRGERTYHAGIRHDATGALVAWTLLQLEPTIPDHAWQQVTIVDPEHRGHRLGLRTKLANLRHLVEHEPAVRAIDTWNAASNVHMIRINEVLGFRPVDAWGTWRQEI